MTDELLDHLQQAVTRGTPHATLAVMVQNIRAQAMTHDLSSAINAEIGLAKIAEGQCDLAKACAHYRRAVAMMEAERAPVPKSTAEIDRLRGWAVSSYPVST